MSDRRLGIPDIEQRVDDIRAVMDAVGSERVALIGTSDGGTMSALFAATYPERCWALVRWSSMPRYHFAPDYRGGVTEDEVRETEACLTKHPWGDSEWLHELAKWLAPAASTLAHRAIEDLYMAVAGAESFRACFERENHAMDIRAVLPAFPTLNADTRQIAVRLRDKLTPTLSKIECEMIRLALRDNGGKVDAAARALGISRKGLYLKRQRLGL